MTVVPLRPDVVSDIGATDADDDAGLYGSERAKKRIEADPCSGTFLPVESDIGEELDGGDCELSSDSLEVGSIQESASHAGVVQIDRPGIQARQQAYGGLWLGVLISQIGVEKSIGKGLVTWD